MDFEYIPAKDEARSQHMWTLKGPKGAVHIWARENDPEWIAKYGERWIGGVERHSPVPVYSFDELEKPYHADCFLLGGPCWRGGTSLYFSEHVAPMMGRAPFSESTHRIMRNVLDDFYESNFGQPDEATQ